MAVIEPFRSIHYNPQMVEDISRVLCPPYDVIDGEGQEACYQKHPYNIIRLILGKELPGDGADENKYRRAAKYIDDWQRRGIFVQDTDAAIYFYEQVFSLPCFGAEPRAGEEGRRVRRLGFVALLRLDEDGRDKHVYPHEHTHAAPREDRFKLIESVEANLSPIFTIFSDAEGAIKNIFERRVGQQPVLFEASEENGTENRIWRVTEAPLIAAVRDLMAAKDVFIADGHHRYEVARQFRENMRTRNPHGFKESHNFIMTYFTPLEDDGLCVLPTHRLIKNIRFAAEDLFSCFDVKSMPSCGDLLEAMKAKEGGVGVFGLYLDKKFYLLRISDKRECNRWIQEGPKEFRNLDVAILHKVIFDHLLKIRLDQIHYQVGLTDALRAVDEKKFDALFILNPTRVEQIRSIALSGEVMPQKSTYFYPKLLSGFLIHKF